MRTSLIFWLHLSETPDGFNTFLDRMAINVSEMFRNPEKWAELHANILPELGAGDRPLKIWSAGCSYGAESYSLAMILDTSFPGDHTIIGTDIDHAALRLARAPSFADADIACLPQAYQDAYLKHRETAGWRRLPSRNIDI